MSHLARIDPFGDKSFQALICAGTNY